MRSSFIAVLFFLTGAATAQNLNLGLTACYALNGNATEPVNGLTGTLSAVTPTINRFNNANSALEFQGAATSIVLLPNNSLIKCSPAISISGWFKPAALNNWMDVIFAKNVYSSYFTSYSASIQDHGAGYRLRGYRQDGSGDNFVESSTIINANTWYHFVVSIDNTTMKLYINGVLEDVITNTITQFNYDATRCVILGGTNESNWNLIYKGSMDNFRFYNRMLTAQEVSLLYSQDPECGVNPQPPVSSFTASTYTVCQGGTLSFTDQSSNSPSSWSW